MRILTIDVGGTAIKHALLEETGKIIVQDACTTPKDSLTDFLSTLKTLAEAYQNQFGNLAGAAFSFPGSVDEDLGVIHNILALPFLRGIPLLKKLSDTLGLPVTMENDANCAALGENWLGAAKGARDVCFVLCGTGVGGALLHEGRILHGRHFLCGEIGLMRLAPDGPLLNEAGSVGGLVQRVAKEKGLPENSLDGEKVFAMAEAGDTCAQEQIAYMFRALALGLVNARYFYDPDLFLLGGAISSRPDFVPALLEQVKAIIAREPDLAVESVVIKACQHGNNANLLGAAKHFLQKHS